MIASLTLAAAAAFGCADHWQVSLDDFSFANNGAGVSFAPAELSEFRVNIETALKRAIGDACAEGKIAPELAASSEGVTIFAASGVTEPQLFLDDAGALRLEWVFAEEGLAVPPDAEIVVGTACWTDPASETCLAMVD